MKKLFLLFVACLSVSMLSVTSHAALIDRGGGLIYDTDLNITWLKDANAATPLAGDLSGSMPWDSAMTWASIFSYYDSVRNVTYDDWRLPTTLQPDATCQYNDTVGSYGHNCTGSEMGHLFYNELGGVAGQSIITTHNANYNLFQNVQSKYYWSGTEWAPDTTLGAWGFSFSWDGSQGQYIYTDGGVQSGLVKGYNIYAWAVRDGDVAAPEPTSLLLLGTGLVGLMGLRRKWRK